MTTGTPRSRGDEIVRALLTQPYPRDPYPLYHELRSIDAVFPSEAGPWILTSYDACALAFRSPLFGQGESAELVRQDPRFEWSAVLQSLGQMMVFMDPPDHTRLRRIVSRVFSPRVIDELRPYVQRVVDDLLVPLAGSDADLVTDFADLIPVTVICELLGVPHEDHEQCRAWSEEIALAIEPVVPDDFLRRADAATRSYQEYFATLIAEKRARPQEDLLTLLIRAEDQGDQLNNAELVAMATLLLGAGFETTRNGIAGGILALLTHPDELAQLRRDATLDKSMVDEVLRYVSPNQTSVARFTLEDVDVFGTAVPKGALMAPVIAAANRDPARFADPDRLDIDRPDNLPLTFAPGPHLCLGAPVARLEVELALTTLARRFPGLELLDDDPPMRNTCNLGPGPRGPQHLPVAMGSQTGRR
ncbi:MAG TPA: cytochrome P450 [Acidimicrobiales bacterium]|nr:cytochrome P450 [Acidimicrobiales bacterium]